MTRGPFFGLLTASLAFASVSRADVAVAPPPREIRADGTHEPAPAPVAAKRENPLEVVGRIIKNSKTVGEKLAMTDTGIDTRKTQDTILKDIQSLIDNQENPPPKPDQNPDDKSKDDKEKDKKPDDKNNKKDDAMPMDGMSNKPPMKKDMQSTGGMEQPKERKPRQNSGDEQKDQGGKQKDEMNPGDSGNEKKKEPSGGKPQDSKHSGGKLPEPSPGDPKTPGSPSLPIADDAVKNVWGHLPDKLRQQATQYYKQEFMPRYTELLKHYYSSLSEKPGKN